MHDPKVKVSVHTHITANWRKSSISSKRFPEFRILEAKSFI
jgi:hypothetical protein